MTLQQAKEQIAKDNGWDNWESISGRSKHSEGILWTMAAELYASSLKDRILELEKQNAELKEMTKQIIPMTDSDITLA